MFKLLLAEFRRNWILFTRYPAEALGKVLAITIFFCLLFFGSNYLAGGATAQFGERLDAIIVGYILWTLVQLSINEISLELQTESQVGTLEQIFLSPFGALRVFLARSLASSAFNLLLILLALIIILIITGSRLYFAPSLLLPLFTTLMSAYGLAFITGAIVLIFKRIGQLLGLLQFPVLFLFVTPFETWQGLSRLFGFLLPMTPSITMLRSLMVQGGSFNGVLYSFCLLNGFCYFSLGLVIFRIAERFARKQGKLGGY
ncbi:MAG: ABC transporter permease [Cyanobacteria bacterium J06621_8]